VKEHPILFSTEMVRALLAGKKTVTRRLSKSWLKVKAGDLLWVRETIDALCGCDASYVADNARLVDAHPEKWDIWQHGRDLPYRTIPSIFMPKWASRITLRATEDARVERLRDITEEEALAEGCEGCLDFTAAMKYAVLWDSLNGKTHPWKSNPEVVRIAFKREQS